MTKKNHDDDGRYRNNLSRNLAILMAKKQITGAELAQALKMPTSTLYNWINGEKMPRMGSLQILADYFGVTISDLIEERSDYYNNPLTQAIAEELQHNKELAMLFMTAKDADPETLKAAHDVLLLLKKREKGEE